MSDHDGGKRALKVTVVRGGGFSGLVSTTDVDSRVLPPGDREELQTRVDGVRSELAAAQPSPPRAGPDEASVRLEIEDESGRQTITAPETRLSPAQRALVDWLGASPHREERVSPPG